MTRIHMDTEAVRETARLLDWTCGELYYMPPKLKNLAGSLSSAWQGGRSGHYAGELRRMGEILQREVINLQRLAIRVRNEVEEWEGADASHDFRIGSPVYSMTLGTGSLAPNVTGTPVGWLDIWRAQLKEIFNSEAGTLWTTLGLAGVFIPTWFGGAVQLFADFGEGTNDFMSWSIKDWEKYDTFGEEVAASLFDYYFVYQKTSVSVSLDVMEFVVDTLDLIPGGYLATASVGLGIWTYGQSLNAYYDSIANALEAHGKKDVFVDYWGKTINRAIQSLDASFDPAINQIMTTEPSTSHNSW